MGIATWSRRLFGRGQAEDPALCDPRVDEAIAALMSHVRLSASMNRIEGAGGDGPVLQAVRRFKALHEAYPNSPLIHYAYAAALQVAMQGETGERVLARCVKTHPGFWLARATLKQHALFTWNPFLLPEFERAADAPVHPVINKTVQTNILLATRQGLEPRAVLFLRDQNDDFSAARLSACKIEFMTTISDVDSPQVVAINGRIHDDPANPYQCEATHCPFQPYGNADRFTYELFVRQETFDFVILDKAGGIKHVRRITPSRRMKAAHAELADMFRKTVGTKLTVKQVLDAQERHRASLDPKTIWTHSIECPRCATKTFGLTAMYCPQCGKVFWRRWSIICWGGFSALAFVVMLIALLVTSREKSKEVLPLVATFLGPLQMFVLPYPLVRALIVSQHYKQRHGNKAGKRRKRLD